MKPACWVWTTTWLLLSTTPREVTSNCWYRLCETPADEGATICTTGTPLAAAPTWGVFAPVAATT